MKVTTEQRFALTTLAVLAATTTSVWAVDANTVEYPNFDTLVVTGTRTEEPVSKVPANMSVVTGKELQDRHVTNMEEALRTVPGVTLQTYGTPGHETFNKIRINGSDQVQYLVDGISMTMPNIGYFTPVADFQNMDGINRVEVLKGAASSLYGSNAVGGVINVITAKPQEGVKTKVRFMGGSYNQEQYGIANEGRQDNIYWRATYVKNHLGDYRNGRGDTVIQNDHSHTGSFMIGDEIDSNNDVRLVYESYRANVKYWDPYATTHESAGHRKYDSFRGIWNNKINDNWKHSFHVGRNEYEGFGDFWIKVRSIDVGDQVTYEKGKHKVIGGFDWNQYKAVSVNSKKTTNAAYYLQDSYNFAPKWTLTPGLRLDHHSTFGSHTTPHVSLGYDINDKSNVYVAYNRFFVAPTPFELYDVSSGNPGLKPEQGYEWSAGVYHKWNNRLFANAAAFERRSSNKIAWAGRYQNVSKLEANGLTFDITNYISSDWSTRLGYTYTHVKGNLNAYTPKHEVIVGVDYNHHKWDAHFDMRVAMQRRGLVDGYFPRNSYTIANLSANYQATKNLKVFGVVNNIFDTFYAEHTISAGNWYTMPGRNYRLGVELSF